MKFIGMIILLVPFLSFAGGSDGGGGNGVVCYDQKDPKKILSVDLLDFYEGRILDGYKITDRNGTYLEIYKEVVKKAGSQEVFGFLDHYVNLSRGFKFLPEGVRLKPIDDSSEIFIPENCKVEQIVNFQGFSRIYIVSDYWNRLSETHKAGLLLHEIIWFSERSAGVKNSSRARRTVARFFAENYPFVAVESDPYKFDYFCSTVSSLNVPGPVSRGSNTFYVRKNDDNTCELHFQTLNNAFVYSSEVAELESCSEFMNPSIEGDGFGIILGTNTFSKADMSITYDISMGSHVEVSGNTRKISKTFEIHSLEFPNYSEPEQQLYCEPIGKLPEQ